MILILRLRSTIGKFILFGFLVFACNYANSQDLNGNIFIKFETDSSSTLNDFSEIQNLIREVYIWHDEGNPSEIGMKTDPELTKYVGYNLAELGIATNELQKSDFFTSEFIENYESIHLAVNEKLENGEIEWLVGSLPNFGSDAEPWCYCQDVPYDEPNPWSKIDIETINLSESEGEFYWKWGGIEPDAGSGWNAHKYRFNAQKVNGKWKISYLEGLNLEDFTRKN